MIWIFRYKGWPAWPCLVYSCCLTWLTGQMLCTRGGLETIGLTTILNRTIYICISMYKLCLSVYLFVCIQKKLQTAWLWTISKLKYFLKIYNIKQKSKYSLLWVFLCRVTHKERDFNDDLKLFKCSHPSFRKCYQNELFETRKNFKNFALFKSKYSFLRSVHL